MLICSLDLTRLKLLALILPSFCVFYFMLCNASYIFFQFLGSKYYSIQQACLCGRSAVLLLKNSICLCYKYHVKHIRLGFSCDNSRVKLNPDGAVHMFDEYYLFLLV